MLKLAKIVTVHSKRFFFFKVRGIALKQGNILIQFQGCCFLDCTVLKTV